MKAGVSRTTVSFVLNGRDDSSVKIPEETRRRVLEVAESIGYRRNDLVRAVVSGKSRMIGFLGFTSKHESAARMMESALDEAEARDYTIKVFRFQDDPTDQSVVNRCVQLRLAGIITMFPGARDLEYLHSEVKRYQIPIAQLDDSLPSSWGIRVMSDDQQGMELAVEHLAQQGHRRIAYVSGDPAAPMSILRETGYRQAMERLGLPVRKSDVGMTHWKENGTERVVETFLKNPSGRPTAILCLTDSMAMEVLRYLRHAGLDVPKDISVVGFSNAAVSELADPPLTTVAQPFEEMGRAAVRHLIERIETKATRLVQEPHNDLQPTRLIVRQSTGPAPEKE